MSSTTPTTSSDTEPPPEQQPIIPTLPNDVTVNILARIPRTHHPHLRLVSKPFLSLLSSPLYYNTRTLLHFTQPHLYLSLRLPKTTTLSWFTLFHNPTSPKTIKNNFLIPLPSTPSALVGSAFVFVGSKIYVIGGSIGDVPTAQVWALDCRFHRWESVSSMSVSREFPAAGVVDGKVYVIGGCVVDNWARSRNWAEVYDPGTGKWEAVDSNGEGGMLVVREKWMHASAVIDGRIYAMADRDGVVYDPRRKEWGNVEKRLDLGWRGRACVVDGVLYCYDYLGKIRGFDFGEKAWRELRGVEKELPKFLCGATMANSEGKLVVVWERKDGKEMEVWCAEITAEKRRNELEGEVEVELWGKVEWCDVVHKAPVGSSIVHCLAVTL